MERLSALRAATYVGGMSSLRAMIFLLVGATAWGCAGSDATAAPAVDSAMADTAKPDTAAEAAVDSAADSAADSTTGDASDAAEETAADTAPVCDLGASCSATQPCSGAQICYGFGETGFCAPFEPQCGGIVMKPCTGGRTCLRASGSSLGYCADAAEMACICGKPDAGKIDGC